MKYRDIIFEREAKTKTKQNSKTVEHKFVINIFDIYRICLVQLCISLTHI